MGMGEARMRNPIQTRSILAAAFLFLVGCNAPTIEPRITMVAQDSGEPVSDPEPTPTYSVLKNWGWKGDILQLDFSAYELNETMVNVPWYQYEAGQFLVPGREYRRCRADITISGTAEAGTITIDNSRVGWSVDPDETFNEPECPGVPNGSYGYSVDENGLTLDGVLYTEQ